MPTIYDIDFVKFGQRSLPPDKRFTRTVKFLNALTAPLQWVRDLWMGDYRTGSTAIQYAPGTYAKYDRVILNKIVYESKIDGNTDAPTVTASWFIVQQNFIGLSERITYNGQTLVLTYALNKWFGTTFRQPPLISDIYIGNNTVPIGLFRVADIEINSSNVSDIGSSEYVANVVFSGSTATNFTIYVPVAVYEALDPTLLNNDKIFRNFADRYIPAGLLYTIETY